MTEYLRKIRLIYSKDLKIEFRTMNNLVSTVVFALMLVFIFSFSLQLADLDLNTVYAPVLWVIILFSSTLGMDRAFLREKENDVIEALLLASGECSSIFFAKFFGNLTLLFLVELIVVPLYTVFTGYSSSSNILLFLATLLLGSWGLALIGTMINSITVQLRSSRVLLPILMFPLAVPLLIAVIESTNSALKAGSGSEGWLYFLIIFDLIFVIIPLILFDYILEL